MGDERLMQEVGSVQLSEKTERILDRLCAEFPPLEDGLVPVFTLLLEQDRWVCLGYAKGSFAANQLGYDTQGSLAAEVFEVKCDDDSGRARCFLLSGNHDTN
jgi:hypothetical protein